MLRQLDLKPLVHRQPRIAMATSNLVVMWFIKIDPAFAASYALANLFLLGSPLVGY